MKIQLLLILLFAGTINVSSQCYTTTWLNPKPTGNPLHGVFAVTEDTVFVAGERGTIVRTFDGGQNWEVIVLAETFNLNSVHFTSPQTGFVAGTIGTNSAIFKTNDAGNTWTKVFDGYQRSLYGNLKNILFTSSDTGYAYFGSHRILYTFNGGDYWNVRGTPATNAVDAIYFLNNNKGFLAGYNQNVLLTTNAGASWTTIPITGISGTDRVASFSFTDSLRGIALTNNGNLAETFDGGATWTFRSTNMSSYGTDIYFHSLDTGYVLTNSLSSQIQAYRSVDSGQTWQLMPLVQDVYGKPTAMSFTGSVGYIVNGLAHILKTTDRGDSWTDQSTGTRSYFYAMDKAGENTLFVAGSREIVKSTDSGNTWNQVFNMSSGSFYSIFFIDSLYGWAAGSNGTFRKTVNSGQTWSSTSSNLGTGVYYSIYFKSVDTGFLGGPGLKKSVNGGQNWTTVPLGISTTIRDIDFYDSNIGYAVGSNGFITRTLDGGNTWTTLNANTTKYLLSVVALNDSVAMAGGVDGHFFRTTDTGNTWIQTVPGWGDNINTIYFKDETEGYMVQSSFNGIVYKTNNGGATWQWIATPTNAYLNDLTLLGDDIILSGTIGWILKLSTNVPSPVVSDVSRCDTGLVNLTVTSPAGYTVNWYNGPDNTATLIDTGYSIIRNVQQNEVVYAQLYDPVLNCSSTRTPVTITIDQPKNITASISASRDTICTGESVLFNASGNADNVIDYQWYYNGNMIGKKFDTVTINNITLNDSIWVVIKSDDYCLADSTATSAVKQIFVATPPSLGISTYNFDNCLKNNSFTFTDSSDYDGHFGAVNWFISDSTTYTNHSFQKSFSQAGSYIIQLIATNSYGCMDSIRTFVSVFPDPDTQIAVDDAEQCFKDNLFRFSDNSTIDSGFSLSRLWLFGDGTTDNSIISYKNYNTFNSLYTVELISISNRNCRDTANLDIELISPDSGEITGDTIANRLAIKNYTVPGNAGSTYEWHIEKGSGSSTANSIDVTWNEIGTGTVKAIETDINGCSGDTVTLDVLINPAAGIDEQVTFFNIHPVPAKNLLNIQTSLDNILKAKIYNIAGVEVMNLDLNEKNTSIDIVAIPAGIYHVVIFDEDKAVYKKKIVIIR